MNDTGRVFWFNCNMVLYQEIGGDQSWWLSDDLDSEFCVYAVPCLPDSRLPPSEGRRKSMVCVFGSSVVFAFGS